MKKYLLLSVMAITLTFTTSCEDTPSQKVNSDRVIAEKTEIVQEEANRQIGLPNIVNFQEKKLMKMIYELRDQENIITHTYLMNEITGEVGQYLGKTLGYGIPYSTQFSNPLKIWDQEKHGGANSKYEDNGEIQLLPQAEPNGLFVPEGLSATWIFLIDEDGNPRPTYVEPAIIVSPVKLK